MVPGFGSWCKAFLFFFFNTPSERLQCCIQPIYSTVTLYLYGNHWGIQCKRPVFRMKNIQDRNLCTGEETAIGICCTEIKHPKSSELRYLQTAEAYRLLPRATSIWCQRSASFVFSLGQCLVEKGCFYRTLGKEQWKLLIFSELTFKLTLFFLVDSEKICWHLPPELQQMCDCPELVLLSDANRISQMETVKENAVLFSFLCSTRNHSQMERVGFFRY